MMDMVHAEDILGFWVLAMAPCLAVGASGRCVMPHGAPPKDLYPRRRYGTLLQQGNALCLNFYPRPALGSLGDLAKPAHCEAVGGRAAGVNEDLQAPAKNQLYPFPEIEARWQKFWEENSTFKTPEEIDTSKPKFYVLDMFPYPSGAGLHVGHPEGYTATDILARYKRMQGFNVLHPMGWDAFGLPAEQYAIETGTHPRITTAKNVTRFKNQLKALGFSYDWERELSTTDPDYYKWTQWIFIQLFKRGLAYQAEVPVNWCPALGTVLANEEVIDGLSERGGHPVIRKPMKQWMLKITEYADRLVEDLDTLDWPESVKDMQRNWIGRSVGAEVDFPIIDEKGVEKGFKIRVYTTRPDTLCGATYLVVAPEHPLLNSIMTEPQKEAVNAYVEDAARKSDLERTELQKNKTGVHSGAYARNPATGEGIPVWVADYVLGSYGTGAIMAVPAHDSRDNEFAVKFGLPIRQVVSPVEEINGTGAYSGEGTMANSSYDSSGLNLNGLSNVEAAVEVIEWLQRTGCGAKKINYKLRDWLFARQRYWGEPFPLIFLEGTGEVKAVPEFDLPVTLPEVAEYSPTGTGEPPLAKAKSWVQTVDSETGMPARREINTMPQWAGSCWYYLRFMDPKNPTALVDPQKERYWGPVNLYVGGAEHSVLHLLYARFWHKVLYDIGVVSTKEPFQCLVNQGMILGEVEYTAYRNADGKFVSADAVSGVSGCQPVKLHEKDVVKLGDGYVLKEDQRVRITARAHKMSKSRGNVVNPDNVIEDFGADSLRLYEMFMGPLSDTKIWSTNGVEGVHRFLGRAWRLVVGSPNAEGRYCTGSVGTESEPSRDQLRTLHKCIRKVTDEIESLRFNTAIAAMMEFVNSANKWSDRPKVVLDKFVLLLGPFAPHLAEELWSRLGRSDSLAYEQWPKALEEYTREDQIILAIQINGKTRGTVELPVGADEQGAFLALTSDKKFTKFLLGKDIKKRIFVPGKILNVIVK